MDICWNSLIQQRYFDGINESLSMLKRIIDEVIDLKEQRIDTLLNKIASHELINLPGDKSIKVSSLPVSPTSDQLPEIQFYFQVAEFIDFIQQQTVAGAKLLEKNSQAIEDAIHDLIKVTDPFHAFRPIDFSSQSI